MRMTHLISQQSSAGPSVTLFKLEDNDSSPYSLSDPESGLELPAPPAHRPKRVKVEIVDTENTVSSGGDGEELSGLTSKAPPDKGKGKGKTARRPPARTRPSQSAASPKKPKAIKQALEKPHPAPARWQETYDAIKEMRSRFPAPVDTMGCDTAKWKEMDPRVRDAYH